MPLVFVGHGSELNILLSNKFVQSLSELGASLPRPQKIIVISSHWCAPEIRITAAESPRLLYNTIKFKEELHTIEYPLQGDPKLASDVYELFQKSNIKASMDASRGYDLATWGIIRMLYPEGGIPAVEISLSYKIDAQGMIDVGKALSPLREENILIIGSGNLVYNPYQASYNLDIKPYDWAIQADAEIAAIIEKIDAKTFAEYVMRNISVSPAMLTPEHILPAVAILAAASPEDRLRYFHYSFQNASISMRSFVLETHAEVHP